MTEYRLAYDGINADAKAIAAVVKPGELVFAYADGMYAWTEAEVDLVQAKGATVRDITVTGDPKCLIYNGPPDNGTQRNWAAFIRGRHALGHDDAIIYTDRDLLPTLRQRCAGMVYDVILAWPGSNPADAPQGCIGKQFAWLLQYDMTAIYWSLR